MHMYRSELFVCPLAVGIRIERSPLDRYLSRTGLAARARNGLFPPPSSDSRPQRCAPAITCPGGGSKVLRWTTWASTAMRPVAGSARSFIEPRHRFSRCAGTP